MSSTPATAAGPGLPPGLQDFDRLPDQAFIDVHALRGLTGRSRASLYRDVERGVLPRPVKFSPGCSRWNVGAVRAALRVLNDAAVA